jgi:undecaprenyl-diphosphatase
MPDGCSGMADLTLPEIETRDPLEQADVVVADRLLPFAEEGLVKAIGTASELSDQEPLYAAAAGVIGMGALLRDHRTFDTGLRMLTAHLLATAVRGMVKGAIDRTRPIAAAERGDYELVEGQRRESDFNSFPSGHTAGAVAVALLVARRHPRAKSVALGLAAASAAAQVIRSKHYVTDVIAGAAVGWIAEELTHAVLARCERI